MKFLYQRLMLRTALANLFIGILIGLLMYLGRAVPALAVFAAFRTAHIHLILIGFMIQMVMGVALWMFPRKKIEPRFTSEREGLTLYALLNIGIVTRTVCEPFAIPGDGLFYGAFAGMCVQTLAILYFVVLIAARIREPAG